MIIHRLCGLLLLGFLGSFITACGGGGGGGGGGPSVSIAFSPSSVTVEQIEADAEVFQVTADVTIQGEFTAEPYIVLKDNGTALQGGAVTPSGDQYLVSFGVKADLTPGEYHSTNDVKVCREPSCA
jgi:hypothetical protein